MQHRFERITHPSTLSQTFGGFVCRCSGSSADLEKDALDRYAKQRLAELRRLNETDRINVSWYDFAWSIRFRHGSGRRRASHAINPHARTREAIDKALEKAVDKRNRMAKTMGCPPIRSLRSRHCPDTDEGRDGDGQGDYEVVIEGSGGEPEEGDEDEKDGEPHTGVGCTDTVLMEGHIIYVCHRLQTTMPC